MWIFFVANANIMEILILELHAIVIIFPCWLFFWLAWRLAMSEQTFLGFSILFMIWNYLNFSHWFWQDDVQDVSLHKYKRLRKTNTITHMSQAHKTHFEKLRFMIHDDSICCLHKWFTQLISHKITYRLLKLGRHEKNAERGLFHCLCQVLR